MIDRPGRGLLRRAPGGARPRRGRGGGGTGGGGGGGGGAPGGGGGGVGGGGGRAGHRRFSFSGPWRPVPAEGRRASKSRSHTYMDGVMGHAPSNGGSLPGQRAPHLDHPAPAPAPGRREAVYFHLRHGCCALNASRGRKRHTSSVHRAQPSAQAAAARCNRSRTPSQSGVAGGVSIQISGTPASSRLRSTANSCCAVALASSGMR